MNARRHSHLVLALVLADAAMSAAPSVASAAPVSPVVPIAPQIVKPLPTPYPVTSTNVFTADGGVTRSVVASFSWSSEVPFETGTGAASGRRQHMPIVLTKQIDSSSPSLLKAFSSGELLPAVQIGYGGHVYKLTNVKVTGDQKTANQLEQITLVYQKITWTWNDGGKTATDDWVTP